MRGQILLDQIIVSVSNFQDKKHFFHHSRRCLSSFLLFVQVFFCIRKRRRCIVVHWSALDHLYRAASSFARLFLWLLSSLVEVRSNHK